MAAEIKRTTISSGSPTPTPTHNNHSPSNSQSSSTHPLPSQPSLPQKEEIQEEDTTAMDTSDSSLPDKKPLLPDNSLRCFTADESLKYDKYEADYASYLRAKYFSDKDMYGGNIFDLAVTVGTETIKASRWSPTRSYADPAQSFVESGKGMVSGEAMPSASASASASTSASASGVAPNFLNGNFIPPNYARSIYR